jgi:hypothetical protein
MSGLDLTELIQEHLHFLNLERKMGSAFQCGIESEAYITAIRLGYQQWS